ncbi:MAG: PPC domain-containing protein [Verrucomicrobia bacterium]|nr:PPC domain-containing protein [Verrucomicrobiota bacterium]
MPSTARNALLSLRLTAPGVSGGSPLGRIIVSQLLLMLVLLAPLHAQLPIARVNTIFPSGGKAGSSLEVTAGGSNLDDPARLHFTHSGLSAVPKGDGGAFAVTVASNVPPGVYEARFVGRFGMSNPRPFVVGQLPESIAPTTNTSAASVAELKLESTINGRVAANTVSWFRFAAKKSQRVIIECLAESIDSRLDPVLAVSDSAGRELERSRTGGLVDFIAPADGSYTLKVSDFLYRGGDEYFYRLTLSTGPRIDFALPAAGLPGTKTNVTFYGRNLPGGKPSKDFSVAGKPLEQLTVEVTFPTREKVQGLIPGLLLRPSDVPVDAFEYRLKSPKGPSNPLLLGLASAPVLVEQEPNNLPSKAQRITPPCEVTGQFFPATEQDWFTFDAKAGEVFWIEVFSQRLGLPTDTFVLVQRVTKNDKGEEQSTDVLELGDLDTNLGDREFNTASRDPSGRFEAKEAGTYRVMVRDLFQRAEKSPRFLYRLSLRRETPDFRLAAVNVVPKYKADAKNLDIGVPVLRRGETMALRVMAFRRDGFNGDIALALENPPQGLTLEKASIVPGKNTETIYLTAAEDAPDFAGPVRLVGKAKLGEKEIVREVRGGTVVFNVGNYDAERPESRLTREFALGITSKETAPLSILPGERKTWEAPANGKLEIPLKIVRRGEFNAKLKLKPVGPGTADALKEFETDEKATNATLKLDLAALKLAAGEYQFVVQTQTGGKYRNNPDAAAFAEAALKEAEKAATELDAAAKKAKEEFEKASKAVEPAEAAAKAAAEKAASAKVALEKAPADEKLIAEKSAAEAAAKEAADKAKAAADSRAAADKAKVEAEKKLKDAQARKEQAAKRSKDATEKAKPRDLTVQVYSTPISVRVTPAVEQAKSK